MAKITFILTDPVLKIIGGYKMVYLYSNSLIEAGYEVTILYRRYKVINNTLLNCLDYLFRFLLTLMPIKWFNLNKKVKRQIVYNLDNIIPSDIYIVTALPTAVEFYEKYKLSKKAVYFIQDFENWGVSSDYVYSSYQNPWPKICVSHWLAKIINQHSQIESICIPNGIDFNIFKDYTPITKRKWHSLAMLYHTQSRKGVEDGLKAIFLLKEKYQDLEVYLFGSSTPSFNLPTWIHFTKNATPKEVAALMNNSNVFLCPSKIEGFGLTGLESIACGCILVSTPTQGVYEYADNSSAIITENFTPKALFESVSYIFDNQEQRSNIVSNSRKNLPYFDLTYCSNKFVKEINKILTQQ